MREDALTGIAAATNPTSSSNLLTLLFSYVPVVIVQVLFLRPTTGTSSQPQGWNPLHSSTMRERSPPVSAPQEVLTGPSVSR